MKRGRVEEVQFGQPPRNPVAAAQPHRLTATTAQHQPGTAGGQSVQYQLSNVLKTAPSVSAEPTPNAQHIQTVQYSTGKALLSFLQFWLFKINLNFVL